MVLRGRSILRALLVLDQHISGHRGIIIGQVSTNGDVDWINHNLLAEYYFRSGEVSSLAGSQRFANKCLWWLAGSV